MPSDLIAALGAPTKAARRLAADQLIRCAPWPEIEGELRIALGDAVAERRWGAAFVLYRKGFADDAVFAGALEALASRDGDLRWAAAEIVVALVRAEAARAARLLESARATSPNARKMALYCLRDLGDHREYPFAEALGDPDVGVRLAAIAGLARRDRIAADTTIQLTRVMESDPEPGVKRAAAVASVRLAGPGTIEWATLEALQGSTGDLDLAKALALAFARRRETEQ